MADTDDTPLKVGAIREAIKYLPDDAPAFVTVPDGSDLSIVWAHHASAVIEPPDQDGPPPWTTREGLELHAEGARAKPEDLPALIAELRGLRSQLAESQRETASEREYVAELLAALAESDRQRRP